MPREFNPAWVAAVSQLVDVCSCFQLQTMRLKELAPGDSRLKLDLANKHLQPFGLVHSGVLATMVDATGFWALYSPTELELGLTTVEMKLNFLAPTLSGQFKATGRAIKMGQTLGLAHGTVTLMALESLSIWGQPQLPPKFLPSRVV